MKRFFRALFHLDHLLVAFFSLTLMQVFILIAFNISFLSPIKRALDNFRLTDIFYDINNSSGNREESDLITLVDMTSEFSRSRLAEAIDEIQALEPAVLGIDIVFDGVRNDAVGNDRLIESVCSTTVPTIWAYKLVEWDDEEQQFLRTFHSFFAEDVEVEEGYTNVQRDTNGGTVRTFGLQRMAAGQMEYSLPAKVAMTFVGDSSLVSSHTDCSICYTATDFPVVPYDSIARHPELIRGRIVLLGATHDIRDMHYTPIGRISGINILAYTVQTLVNRQMPVEISLWHTVLFTLLFVWFGQLCQHGITRFMAKRKSRIAQYIGTSGFAASLMGFFLMVSLVGICFWLFFRFNIYLNTAWAIMGIALLDNARELYALFIHVLLEHFRWPFLRRSLYRFNDPA